MINIFTIVLDGMPYIQRHLPIFEALKTPWHWFIAEGAAGNTGCTSWCKPQPSRLSSDGTTEYLISISQHPKVTVLQQPSWSNKVTMINSLCGRMRFSGVLLEVDADEIHTPANIEKLYSIFAEDPRVGQLCMPCRYFVGPDLICYGHNCWSNRDSEWLRAWRFVPGDYFKTHEPPVLNKIRGNHIVSRYEAAAHGLTFDHFAYATELQAIYKEKFYGYTDLHSRWKFLQSQTAFPQPLSKFFPFADGGTMVTRI